MTITASDINKLRQATGAGMMDCKKALSESNGDFEAAIDNLRKRGQKISANRAGREATEGVAIAKTSSDNTKGIALVLSCETDFVAQNQDFIDFANKRPRIPKVETSGTERAGRHAKAASDAAVKIHKHNAV